MTREAQTHSHKMAVCISCTLTVRTGETLAILTTALDLPLSTSITLENTVSIAVCALGASPLILCTYCNRTASFCVAVLATMVFARTGTTTGLSIHTIWRTLTMS